MSCRQRGDGGLKGAIDFGDALTPIWRKVARFVPRLDAGASLICSCVAIVDCIETSATDLSLKSLGCPHRRAA